MKSLKQFFEEHIAAATPAGGGIMSTPGNTMGMGNPSPDSGDAVKPADLRSPKTKKQKVKRPKHYEEPDGDIDNLIRNK